jgi:hypothetical protein
VLGTAGDVLLDAVDWRDLAADVQRKQGLAVQLMALPGETYPHLVLGAPVTGLDGSPAGALVSVLDAEALAQRIERQGSNVTLADGHGRTIACGKRWPSTALKSGA